jgi:hypothetical protein
MPEYTAPGVYVEQGGFHSHPIVGVSTSTAAFVGVTETGPMTPTFIENVADYEATFGGFSAASSFMWAAVRGFFANGGTRCYIARLDPSADPSTAPKATLDTLRDLDVSIVCAPNDPSISGMTAALIAHCDEMRYRIAVLDAPQSPAPTDGPPSYARSSYAAFYYPWVRLQDPCGKLIAVPPSGFIAGIYAQNDSTRGVWHAPAGLPLVGIESLDQIVTEQEQSELSLLGVNELRHFPERGNLVWGARTTSNEMDWKYINVRRLLIYLEHSIDQGTQWVVFEPNGPALWANVKTNVENFLFNEWQRGALQGSKPEAAFFARCDQSTMTQDDIADGRLICQIGVAPLKPAEFVIFRIGQWTSGCKRC